MNLVPAALPITNGTTFYNKYRLMRPIGRGSFGEVWLAQDQAVNHEYAIKVLNAGIGIDERLREAQVGHAFTHNNLVRVHQADVATDGKVVIAMDYFPEGSITTLANPRNFLPLPTALRTVIDMLQGLEHLHLHNFFHNDVKPQNILRGRQGQAKLADYGIVGISATGAPVQPSSWYVLHAAPETVAGNGIEARTDIFQTGLTLFRLLVGLPALEAKFNTLGDAAYADALARGSLITRADFPPFIPNAVCRAVMTSIAPNPAKRFQSALDMRRALEKLSYSGHWTVDATGMLRGEDARHTYRFEQTPAVGSNASVSAFKTNRTSGRETRISQFTDKNLSKPEAGKLIVSFLKAVVDGKVL
ncbi:MULTISPECIES: serine/threonine-protein kinase [unclassified Pannonibacter]|uniref:serine/threonine-protein kinase n=1 Tax=unclassified Pannonibacter TaxID=2627228 RepID=UPI00164597C3|nr:MULTISPECIES: serine/threonine-protein kinase [unclassified Pannonibacter]